MVFDVATNNDDKKSTIRENNICKCIYIIIHIYIYIYILYAYTMTRFVFPLVAGKLSSAETFGSTVSCAACNGLSTWA